MTMTLDKAIIAALLARVKAATGPDRELDCRLSHHFLNRGISYGTGDDSGWAPPATVDGWDDAKWASMADEYMSPLTHHYTASVDAALSLVERVLPGWEWLKKSPRVISLYRPLADEEDARKEWAKHHDGTGATIPLAILAALLSALITQENGNG